MLFEQSTQLHVARLQYAMAAKQSQYNLRHFDFLQLHVIPLGEKGEFVRNAAAAAVDDALCPLNETCLDSL